MMRDIERRYKKPKYIKLNRMERYKLNNIKICCEKKEEYAEIANLQYLAFENEEHIGETVLIDVLRHRKEFDPELSLVAKANDQIIGHILFNPFTLYHGNKKIPAVNLAPLAVHPNFQKKGIGSRLIKKGHKLAKKKGYHFSFLWGHSEYYPRFGYLKEAFAQGGIKVKEDDIPSYNKSLKTKMPGNKDISFLIRLWKKNFINTGLSIFPGKSITD